MTYHGNKILKFCVPADGKKFELKINGGEVDLMGVVRDGGWQSFKGWKRKGSKIVGYQTGIFRIIRVADSCASFIEVWNKITGAGFVLAPGEWREAFLAKYTHPDVPDERCLIGFAGSLCLGSDGHFCFPYLEKYGARWESLFYSIENNFSDRWCWLVQDK